MAKYYVVEREYSDYPIRDDRFVIYHETPLKKEAVDMSSTMNARKFETQVLVEL